MKYKNCSFSLTATYLLNSVSTHTVTNIYLLHGLLQQFVKIFSFLTKQNTYKAHTLVLSKENKLFNHLYQQVHVPAILTCYFCCVHTLLRTTAREAFKTQEVTKLILPAQRLINTLYTLQSSDAQFLQALDITQCKEWTVHT